MISLEKCNLMFEPLISLVPCLPGTTTAMRHSHPAKHRPLMMMPPSSLRVQSMTRRTNIKMTLRANATARSIHDAAKEALKRGAKSLDDEVKKMSKLEDDLAKTRAKLTNVSETMRKAIFERNAAFVKKKTASETIRTTKKELANAKNELADAKKDVTIVKKDVDQLIRQNGKEASRGDSIDRYREK
jgi:hypothetical protein